MGPYALHYGLLIQIAGDSGYSFDKHWAQQFDPSVCPPWHLPPSYNASVELAGGLFPHPPPASSFETKVTVHAVRNVAPQPLALAAKYSKGQMRKMAGPCCAPRLAFHMLQVSLSCFPQQVDPDVDSHCPLTPIKKPTWSL